MTRAVLRVHKNPETIRINPADFEQYGGELRTMEECLPYELVADPTVPVGHVTISCLDAEDLDEEE